MWNLRLGLLAFAAVLALTGCGNAYLKSQRSILAAAMPGAFEVPEPVVGEPRVARIRIWVDDDFRVQHVRWKVQIEEQVDEANQFLIPALGMRLEIAEIKPWSIRQADRSMEQVVTALETLDSGDGVTWVVGFTSSVSLASPRFETLGATRLLGRHMVVRGDSDVDERRQFERNLPDTSPAERERVHQARQRHRQALVLIHELGHSLGAPHEVDSSWIMYDAYHVKMTQLSLKSRALMQITLESWLGGDSDGGRPELVARLVSYFESNPWGGWGTADLEEWLLRLRALGSRRDTTPEVTPDIPVPPAAYPQYQRAQQLAQAGKYADAIAELDLLVTVYPATAEIRQALCEAHLGLHGVGHAMTAAACERAAEVSPNDPRPYLVQARALITDGQRPRAIALLGQAATRAGERAPMWDQLATFYQGLGLVTHAERAAARSTAIAPPTEPNPVTQWAARTRARYGLPPDARKWRIAIDEEGEYLTAIRELLDLVYASKNQQVLSKASAAEKRWKGAPGILAARCDLELRDGNLSAARQLCKRAITAWPGAAWAHYLSGVIEFQSRQPKLAVAALRRAIARDPELAQAYRALAKALKATGDTAGQATLAAEYNRRFGSALAD